MWKTLFERIEEQIVKSGATPISLQKNLPRLERAFLEIWALGQNITIEKILNQVNLSTVDSQDRKLRRIS